MAIMSTRRWSVVAIGVAASVVLTAASVAAASPSPLPSPSIRPDTSPVVRVLDPGMEPRSALRYVFQSGQSTEMSMDMDISVKVASDGVMAPATVIPPMHIEAWILIDDVSPTGTARYDFRYISAGVIDPGAATPEVVAQIRASLAGLVGVSGWAIVNDRGRTLDGGFNGMDSLDATIRALLDDVQRSLTEMSAPLPEEPVGAGARWVVEQHLPTQGVVVHQAATYTLDGREGDVLRLSIDLTQSVQPVPTTPPASSPSTDDTASVVELSGSGNGTMVVSLGDLVPTSQLTTLSHSVVEAAGSRATIDTTLSFRVGPGGASAPVASETPAERVIRVSHILFSPNDDPSPLRTPASSDPTWEAARREAFQVAAALRAISDPTARRAEFERRARAVSDDVDSGAQGGDLGALTRKELVPEFGDPLFDAVDPQSGDIIGPVRTEFGWHVIMYDGEGTASDRLN